MRLLVENLLSEPTTPEHLTIILDMGHLHSVGVCLDLGHAHITVGVREAMQTLANRIVSVHTHDNHGVKDEHLWPGDGSIDWAATIDRPEELSPPPAIVLEIGNTVGEPTAVTTARIHDAFARLD